jgi:glutamine cyclotransferase
MTTRWIVLAAALLTAFTASCARSRSPITLPVSLVAAMPHDPEAYTQGLQWIDGRLFESTGLYGQSSVREVDLSTGTVLRRYDLPAMFFGEGLTRHDGTLYLLTWREQTLFTFNPDTLEPTGQYPLPGEGWGLTSDGDHLIKSDGSSTLTWFDPATRAEIRRLRVTENGKPLINLNELEWIDGWIFANVYLTDRIVVINPADGRVHATLDLGGLRQHLPRPHRAEVLNGIAYRPDTGHLLVTGKQWPRLFALAVDLPVLGKPPARPFQ